jgi:hypothetical protein
MPAADACAARSALRIHLGEPYADHDDVDASAQRAAYTASRAAAKRAKRRTRY